jgi:hypothetical protein
MISYRQEKNKLQYDNNIDRTEQSFNTSTKIVILTAPLEISAKRFTASRMIAEISSSLQKTKIANKKILPNYNAYDAAGIVK